MSRHITLSAINPTRTYFTGNYLGIKVVMNEDGLINISKLMRQSDYKGKFQAWKQSHPHLLLLKTYLERGITEVVVPTIPPPSATNKEKEDACNELLELTGKNVTVDILKTSGDKAFSNDLKGWFQPQCIVNSMALSISPEFYWNVMTILEEFTKDKTDFIIKQKDNKIDAMNDRMNQLEALIKGGQNEAAKQAVETRECNVRLLEDNKTTHKLLSKLQLDVKSVKEYLKNQECSKEVMVYYRPKGVPHKNFCIRAGELKGLRKYFDEDKDDVTIYENISNPKLLLRKMKDLDYLPRNKLCNFEMEDTKTRRKVRNFIGAVNTELSE
jgi:hypothetical protein